MPEISLSDIPSHAVALGLVAFVVGGLTGAVGIGGILLLPAIVWLAGQPLQSAAATVLFGLAFTGLYGAYLHRRSGSLDWRRTAPVCVFAVATAGPGVWLAYRIATPMLAAMIALLILLMGINVLWGRARAIRARPPRPGGPETAVLCGVGAVSGLGAGLSGAGGPLFAVPIMLLLGYPPLATIAMSQVLQVFAATAGASIHAGLGTLDLALAVPLACVQLAGAHAGARLAQRAHTGTLRSLAGSACIVIGSAMLIAKW